MKIDYATLFPVRRRGRLVAAVSGTFVAALMAGCGPQVASTPSAPSTGAPVANAYQAPTAPVPGAPVVQGGVQAPLPPAPYPPQTLPAGQPVPAAPVAYANPPAPVYAQAPAPTYAPPPSVQRAAPRDVVVQREAPIASNHVGRISAIEPIRERPQGSGAGGVLGGVLGAVVGNQFGHGNGRTAMTVLGAAGGAVAGNNVERNIHERVVGYRVSVRLEDGEVRSFQESNAGDLQVGDRVRVDGQRLRRI